VIAVVAVVAIWFIRKRKRGINTGLGLGVDGEQGSSSQMMMREQGKFDPDRKGGFEDTVRNELGAEQPVVELYGERGMGDKKETRLGAPPMELAA
jgi:hypothetical protein